MEPGQGAGLGGQVQTPVAFTQLVVPRQETGDPHCVQPLDPARQVSEPPFAHRCVPATQAFVQIDPPSGCASVAASA